VFRSFFSGALNNTTVFIFSVRGDTDHVKGNATVTGHVTVTAIATGTNVATRTGIVAIVTETVIVIENVMVSAAHAKTTPVTEVRAKSELLCRVCRYFSEAVSTMRLHIHKIPLPAWCVRSQGVSLEAMSSTARYNATTFSARASFYSL